MVTLAIDTMEILNLFADQKYSKLASAASKKTVTLIVSAISLTEIYKVIGAADEEKAKDIATKIIASDLEVKAVDTVVARKAGEIRLHYRMPTADSLIAATGITTGATHILTQDAHFRSIKRLIKPVSLKQAERLL